MASVLSNWREWRAPLGLPRVLGGTGILGKPSGRGLSCPCILPRPPGVASKGLANFSGLSRACPPLGGKLVMSMGGPGDVAASPTCVAPIEQSEGTRSAFDHEALYLSPTSISSVSTSALPVSNTAPGAVAAVQCEPPPFKPALAMQNDPLSKNMYAYPKSMVT